MNGSPRSQLVLWGCSRSERDAHKGSERRSYDATEEPDVGFALLWVADFDSQALHERIVELVIELMEHAVSHADDTSALTEFEAKMHEFDVAEFVEQYREERNLEEETFTP